MDYNKVEIKGHQRAGNHYLAYLINNNFFNYDNYYSLFNNGNHKFGYEHTSFNSDTLYIYIYRNLEDTAKSFLKIRGRFCIGTSKLDDLLSDKPMRLYASKKEAVGIVLDRDAIEAFKRAGDSVHRRSNFTFTFGDLTFREWHSKHISSWTNIKRDNLIFIRYEDLIQDFHNTMLYISRKLGSDRTNFINMDKRLGVLHKGADVWTG